MKNISVSIVICWAAIWLCLPAVAQDTSVSATAGQVYPVDDSGTVVIDPVVRMQWQPPGRTGSTSLVSAATRVSVQLNLVEWVGRSGRIYMTLPSTAGPIVRATWRTGGTLVPGTLVSGERSLVYNGPIESPILRDLIDIELDADGAQLAQPKALAFAFEIEIDQ